MIYWMVIAKKNVLKIDTFGWHT